MKPRIAVITICVDGLERALRFYRDGLGLRTEGVVGKEFEYGAVAFFDLQSDLKLALWPRGSLSRDSGIPVEGRSATEFTLGHNVASKAEVDAVMKQAKDAGAFIVKPARDAFWGGYSGYFQDPDGHLWEVVWNPQLLPKDDGEAMSANKVTVMRYMEGFNRGDHAQILSCLTDDVEWVMPGFFHLTGKEAFDKEIEDDAFVGSPTIVVTRLIEDGDVVAAEGTARCARKGGGMLNAVFCDVFAMRGGRIRRLTSYLNEVKD